MQNTDFVFSVNWENNLNGNIITGAFRTIEIGQYNQYSLQVVPSATVQPLSWTPYLWNFFNSQPIVQSYTQNIDYAHGTSSSTYAQQYAGTDISKIPFYVLESGRDQWLQGFGQLVGRSDVEQWSYTPVTEFDSIGPSVTNVGVAGVFGAVQAGPDTSFGDRCEDALMFGEVHVSNCPGPQGSPGVTYTFTAKMPSGVGGLVDATGLIDASGSVVPNPVMSNTPTPVITTSGNYYVDTCLQYGPHVAASPGATVDWTGVDAPALELNPSDLQLQATDNFTIYFVFRPTDRPKAPAGERSIWVPIGSALQWFWSGTATEATPTPNPLGSPTPTPIPSPMWTLSNASSSTYQYGTKNPYPEPTWIAGYTVPTAQNFCPPVEPQ